MSSTLVGRVDPFSRSAVLVEIACLFAGEDGRDVVLPDSVTASSGLGSTIVDASDSWVNFDDCGDFVMFDGYVLSLAVIGLKRKAGCSINGISAFSGFFFYLGEKSKKRSNSHQTLLCFHAVEFRRVDEGIGVSRVGLQGKRRGTFNII